MNVVVAGHLCLDIIPRWEHGDLSSLIPGSLLNMEEITFSTGGAVSNTGITLKRLGFDPILMARLVADYVGDITRRILEDEGISTETIITSPDVSSSYTVVISPPNTDRLFLHHPGANDAFSAYDVRLSGLKPGLFHLGYPPLMRQLYTNNGRNLETINRHAKEQGWITSLDLALPDPNSEAGKVDWHTILARVLPYADLFLPSLDEVLYMLEREKFVAVKNGGLPITTALLDCLSGTLLDFGATAIVLKLGDHGLYLRTGSDAGELLGESWNNRQLLSPVFKVQVKGTTGAGDASIAGFLAAVIRGADPEEAGTLATAVGACCVESLSATDGVPSIDAVRRRIDEGWPRVSPSIELGNWHSAHLGVFHGPRDKVG